MSLADLSTPIPQGFDIPVSDWQQTPASVQDEFLTLLNRVDFYKGNAERVMRKLRRLYYKAEPTAEDIRILLGTLTAINVALDEGGSHHQGLEDK